MAEASLYGNAPTGARTGMSMGGWQQQQQLGQESSNVNLYVISGPSDVGVGLERCLVLRHTANALN